MDLATVRATLLDSADALAEAGARLRTYARDSVHGPGRLGDLARDLAHQRDRALDARGREAAAQADRLRDLADVVSRASRGYAGIDDDARRRQVT